MPENAREEREADDQRLMKKAQAGDQAAFAELFEKKRTFLKDCCYRIVQDRDEAEDIVAATYLRAWQNRGQYRGDSPVLNWLYRIAINLSINHFNNKKNRRTEPIDNHEDLPDKAPSVEKQVIDNDEDFRKRLTERLAEKLKYDPTNILLGLLHYLLYFSQDEAAGLLQINKNMAKSRFQRKITPAVKEIMQEETGR